MHKIEQEEFVKMFLDASPSDQIAVSRFLRFRNSKCAKKKPLLHLIRQGMPIISATSEIDNCLPPFVSSSFVQTEQN